jgi:hypothetical protein
MTHESSLISPVGLAQRGIAVRLKIKRPLLVEKGHCKDNSMCATSFMVGTGARPAWYQVLVLGRRLIT